MHLHQQKRRKEKMEYEIWIINAKEKYKSLNVKA